MRMAEELLEELRRCGVQVEARGEVLHVEAPRGALSPELVRSLRRLKPALLRLVAPEAARTVGETLSGVSETGASLLTAEVCAMRLEEFARAGLIVEVWSAVLEEAVDSRATTRGWTRGNCGLCIGLTSCGCCSGLRRRGSCGGFTRSRGCSAVASATPQRQVVTSGPDPARFWRTLASPASPPPIPGPRLDRPRLRSRDRRAENAMAEATRVSASDEARRLGRLSDKMGG